MQKDLLVLGGVGGGRGGTGNNVQKTVFCFPICSINQRTNGPVNAHLSLNIMVFNPSAGADEALGRFSFFQNNQYSVHLPISWLLLAFPFK